jgi:beta-glucosidase
VFISLGVLTTLLSAQQPQQPIYQNASAPIEARVEDLLSRMTIEEKVRQLDLYSSARLIVDKHTDETHAAADAVFLPAKAQEAWGTLGTGGIHDLNPSPELANAIQRWAISHSRLGIPALFIEEGLHGFDNGTVYPAPINLAATWDPALAQQTAAGIAAEARATGVHMILAPVLDLARDPRWGRIEEDFGEDPYLTGQMGLAYVRGAQGDSLSTDHNVIAEPKHFAGHGSPEGGTNTSPVHIGERELRSVMLKSFEPAFREGHAMAVMAAYHEIDGVPVTADPLLFETILRDEWGFKGFVLSDLGAIERLYTAHHVAATPKDAVCLANRSGVDMQFYDFPHDVFQQALIDCVKEGSVSSKDFDYSVRSMLRVKFLLGLFDHPYVDPAFNALTHRSADHLAVSLQSARESMTLLKNERNVLPLSKLTQHIAVIGPNAAIARYGDYEREENGKHIGMVQGIRALLPAASVESNDGSDIPTAVALARNADAVILALGEYQGISGEGFDRSNLDLPGTQQQLMEAVSATGKPVVLVLQNGRPLTIGWAKAHIPAIIEAWYPGEFGGQAIAETLFGDNNPGGKLTITFPRSLGQLPVYYNADPSRVRKYIDDDGKPLFPFGFGLSYTSFTYTHLKAKAPLPSSHDAIEVSVDVTNTGSREGDEVAQLYMRQEVSSVETPERALKGFARLRLEAGETRTVTFRVPQHELEIWNVQKQWVVEPGQYTFWAGGSSTADLSTKITLQP